MSTTQPANPTGVELGKTTTAISNADTANGPLVVAGPDGTVRAFWAELNIIFQKVSLDGGTTFGDQEALLDVSALGNITAGRNQPRPVAAAIDAGGDTHLLLQVADPLDGQRSDIFYTHLETYRTDTDKALVTGGRDVSGQAQTGVGAYDPRTRQWEPASRAALGSGLRCDAGTPNAQDAAARWGQGSAFLGGRVYVAGGEDATGPMDRVQAYDPVTLTWLTDSPLPAPRTGLALVSDGNSYLFAFGGDDGFSAQGSILRFDAAAGVTYAIDATGFVSGCSVPGTSPWSALSTSLPVARTALAAVGVTRADDSFEIHVLGGETFAGVPQTVTNAFRMETDGTLTPIPPLPPLPVARSHFQAVAVGERIYVLGGTSDGTDVLDSVLTIDLTEATPTWRAEAAMPEPRRDFMATVLEGDVYVLGGTGGTDPIALADVYDPDTGLWRTDPESAATGATIGGAVVAVREPSLPRNLSRQAANATQPALARDPVSGDLYATWRNEQEVTFGQFDTRVTSDVYLSRSEDNGRTFSPAPVKLSSLGPLASLNSNFSGNPQVAVSPDHRVHLAWIETGEPGTTAGQGQDLIYTNCLPSTTEVDGVDCSDSLVFFPSQTGDPTTEPPAGTLRSPTLATDAVGGVYLAWIDRDGTVPIARASAVRTYALNVYFTRRLAAGNFTPPVTVGVRLPDRMDEIFPPGTLVDAVAAIAGLVTKVDVPRLVAYGNGQVNVLWTDDAEIRLRRSTDGGVSFLDELGVADLSSGASRISPDLTYEAGSGRMTALWQSLTAGAAANEVNSLVETRYLEPL